MIACILSMLCAMLKQISNSKTLGQLIWSNHQVLRPIFLLLLKCMWWASLRETESRQGFIFTSFLFYFEPKYYISTGTNNCVCFVKTLLDVRRHGCVFVGLFVFYLLFLSNFTVLFCYPVR